MSAHRVVISFDDGVYSKLVCPDDGSCAPATVCASCGRGVEDTEGTPCYDCPRRSDECWVKGWFDNCMTDELLNGEVTVEIDPEFDGDRMIAHITRPLVSVASPNKHANHERKEP